MRRTMDCPACDQAVPELRGKPMLHYVRGTNEVCDGAPRPCRACGEPGADASDAASIMATGVCRGCSSDG